MLHAKEIFLHAILVSSGLDTVPAVLSWLIGLYSGNGKTLSWKETNFDIYVLFIKFILFMKSLERDCSKSYKDISIDHALQIWVWRPCMKEPVGKCMYDRGNGIERSLLWLGLHKSQMTNFNMMAQNIHGSLV
jgi:hypothetical protein